MSWMVIELFTLASWVIFHAFLSSVDVFQNQYFQDIISGIPPGCQTVLIQIRPNILSGLIWVQTVCNGYQPTTLGGKEITYLVWKVLFLTL